MYYTRLLKNDILLVKFYKFFITVTFALPWNDKPVPAVQDASVVLARMVKGEAVL